MSHDCHKKDKNTVANARQVKNCDSFNDLLMKNGSFGNVRLETGTGTGRTALCMIVLSSILYFEG